MSTVMERHLYLSIFVDHIRKQVHDDITRSTDIITQAGQIYVESLRVLSLTYTNAILSPRVLRV